MLFRLSLLAPLLLIACGENEAVVHNGTDGADGQGCVIEQEHIVCPDGSEFDLTKLQGKNGLDGLKGDKGDQGDRGFTGATGSTGEKGDKGDRGEQGRTGATGATGKTGAKGDRGETGLAGADGKDGRDGIDGKDGLDGKDAVVLGEVLVKKNTCTQIGPNIWAQNISNGYVFDVYSDSSCSDYENGDLKEYCDNVATSFGSYNGGQVGNTLPGSSTLCWVEKTQYSGVRQLNGDILIKALDFN